MILKLYDFIYDFILQSEEILNITKTIETEEIEPHFPFLHGFVEIPCFIKYRAKDFNCVHLSILRNFLHFSHQILTVISIAAE